MDFLSGPAFWREWMASAGFGGSIAALIACAGVRLNARSQQRIAHKEQWWERAKWALGNWSDVVRRSEAGSRSRAEPYRARRGANPCPYKGGREQGTEAQDRALGRDARRRRRPLG